MAHVVPVAILMLYFGMNGACMWILFISLMDNFINQSEN